MPETIDHSKNYSETKDTLLYLREHPYRASLKALFPRISSKDTIRNTVFELANHLCLMGLDDCVLESKSGSLIDAIFTGPQIGHFYDKKSNLQTFLNTLYTKFDEISKDEEKYQIKDIKKLKKLIHTFARLNDFDLRIINTKKETGNEAGNGPAYIVKAAGIKASSIKRDQRKKTKKWLNVGSLIIAIIVAIGEGLTAVTFAASTMAFLPAFLLIGLPAFICNYYLFKGESFDLMKEIYFGKLLKTEDGKSLTYRQKSAIMISLVFTASAATSIGLVTFSTSLVAFGHLMFGLTAAISIGAPPVGLMIITTIIAIVSVMALFTVFSSMIVTFIKKDGPKKMKESILNLPSAIIKSLTIENWKTRTVTNRIQQVAGRIITAIIHLACFALALAISTIMVAAACLTMKKQVAMIFNKTFKASLVVANKTANILVFGIGSVINGVFFTEGIFKVFNDIKENISGFFTKRAASHKPAPSKSNPFQKFQTIKNTIQKLLLFCCIISNSKGEACGVKGMIVGKVKYGIPGLATAIGAGAPIAVEVIEVTQPVTAPLSETINEAGASKRQVEQGNNNNISTLTLFSHPANNQVDSDRSMSETCLATSLR